MADDKTALPEANIPAENKASVDPPQHLEKTYSYESSQLEKGNLRKKLGSKGGMDAELAAVLELVRTFLCVKSALARADRLLPFLFYRRPSLSSLPRRRISSFSGRSTSVFFSSCSVRPFLWSGGGREVTPSPLLFPSFNCSPPSH